MPPIASPSERVSKAQTKFKVDDIALTFAIPELPEIKWASRRIDEEDEQELRWRFGDPHVTQLYSGGSGFGMQLERAEALGYGPLPCRRCGGRWHARKRRKDGKEEVVDWRDGTGLAPLDDFGRRVSYSVALARYRVEQKAKLNIVTISAWPDPDPRGEVKDDIVEAFRLRGENVMTERELCEVYPSIPEDRCRTCPACNGMGVVPRRSPSHATVTARPTGSSKQLGGQERDDAEALERKVGKAVGAARWRDGFMRDGNSGVHFGELQRYIEMERMLADVAQLSPLARAGIEVYYTPAVNPMTAFVEEFFGMRRSARRKTGWNALAEFTPTARQPEATRPLKGQWEASRARQAAELYDFCCKCWNVAAYGAQQ